MGKPIRATVEVWEVPASPPGNVVLALAEPWSREFFEAGFDPKKGEFYEIEILNRGPIDAESDTATASTRSADVSKDGAGIDKKEE